MDTKHPLTEVSSVPDWCWISSSSQILLQGGYSHISAQEDSTLPFSYPCAARCFGALDLQQQTFFEMATNMELCRRNRGSVLPHRDRLSRLSASLSGIGIRGQRKSWSKLLRLGRDIRRPLWRFCALTRFVRMEVVAMVGDVMWCWVVVTWQRSAVLWLPVCGLGLKSCSCRDEEVGRWLRLLESCWYRRLVEMLV